MKAKMRGIHMVDMDGRHLGYAITLNCRTGEVIAGIGLLPGCIKEIDPCFELAIPARKPKKKPH